MTLLHDDPLCTLHHGDCVEVMRELPADSVDAIVTDPPYGLEFMGREWDKLGAGTEDVQEGMDDSHPFRNGTRRVRYGQSAKTMQTWHEAWAREAFRVAKPGAHLLAFGGTRTYHRLASAIEDAGWEIRDCLVWAYASGFPKSLDVSKAIDRAAGAEREVTGSATSWNRPESADGDTARLNASPGEYDLTAPATDAARQWDGWGTALKPAWEPIVMARKPLRGTVAGNVQQYGTGALNIDATRIGIADGDAAIGGAHSANGRGEVVDYGPGGYDGQQSINTGGRWPANVLLTDEVFEPGVDGVVGLGSLTGTMTAWSPSPESEPSPTDSPASNAAPRSNPSEPDDSSRASAIGSAGTQLDAWGTSTDTSRQDTGSSNGTTADASAISGSTDESGRTPTGRSRPATSSTTSTRTATTTASRTLPASAEQSTPPSTSPSAPGPRSDPATEPAVYATSPDASANSKRSSTRVGEPSADRRYSARGGTDFAPLPGARREVDGTGYSRFFLVPKSSRSDREPLVRGGLEVRSAGSLAGRADGSLGGPIPQRANVHPTVKPLDLMRHLVRLVTPPTTTLPDGKVVAGTVLDCFLGSGTTAIAANAEGFRCIGIEREREYLDIALARMAHQPLGLGLDVAAPTRKRTTAGRQGPTVVEDDHRPNRGMLGRHRSDEVPA